MAIATPLAGMAAAAAAAVCFDGAVLLQAGEARAVDDAHGLRLSLVARLARSPRWLLGTATAILGWPLQLLAFSCAPVSVVQPTLALGLVVVLAGGRRVLGEEVRPGQWAAAASVVAGVALVAVAHPPHTEASVAPGPAVVVVVVLGSVVAAPFLRGRGRTGAWPLVAGAGCAFALSSLAGKELTVLLHRGELLPALAAAAATAGVAAVGLLTDMTALQRFAATRVAPPMFVLETVLPVLAAPALFAERWGATPGGGLMLGAGIALVLGGGAVLGRRRPAAGTQPARASRAIGSVT